MSAQRRRLIKKLHDKDLLIKAQAERITYLTDRLTYIDEEEREYDLCGRCDGSGEGSYDGSSCASCGGEGEVKNDC